MYAWEICNYLVLPLLLYFEIFMVMNGWRGELAGCVLVYTSWWSLRISIFKLRNALQMCNCYILSLRYEKVVEFSLELMFDKQMSLFVFLSWSSYTRTVKLPDQRYEVDEAEDDRPEDSMLSPSGSIFKHGFLLKTPFGNRAEMRLLAVSREKNIWLVWGEGVWGKTCEIC